ncbi:hypothetical protein HOY80DRAFT_878300, partial [Tuber brumale]
HSDHNPNDPTDTSPSGIIPTAAYPPHKGLMQTPTVPTARRGTQYSHHGEAYVRIPYCANSSSFSVILTHHDPTLPGQITTPHSSQSTLAQPSLQRQAPICSPIPSHYTTGMIRQ